MFMMNILKKLFWTKGGGVSTDSIKRKLKMLEVYMPNRMRAYYLFGGLLGERLGGIVSPDEFVSAAELLISDVRRGVDSFTGKRLQCRIADRFEFARIQRDIPKIAEAVCPRSFAKEVRKFRKIKQLRESVQ